MIEGTSEYIEKRSPPNNPRYYFAHDRHLSRRYGASAIKGVQKEIEGMARLFESVEADLDNDAREVLLESIDTEITNLFNIEEGLVELEQPRESR